MRKLADNATAATIIEKNQYVQISKAIPILNVGHWKK